VHYLGRVVIPGTVICLIAVAVGGQLQITRYTIDGGGGSSQGGEISISGTIGQPDAGKLSGGEYQIRGGFWVGATGPEPTTETPTPTVTATGVAASPTQTPTSKPVPSGLDVKPDPLDQFIDARDLIEWVNRTKATPPMAKPDILLEIALYWQGVYPPSGKTEDRNK
jgi:hypothetical protein